MKKKLAIIPLLILMVLICCKGNESDWYSGDFYSNDHTKLFSEIIDVDLGIKFNPPLNWVIQSAELSKKIESSNKIIGAGQKSFSYSPVYLFFNKQTGSLLSVGFVEYSDSSDNMGTNLVNYKNLITNKYRNDKLSIGSFTKSTIKFSQFKSEKENFVNYKIIFNNSANKIIQFDCTIQKDNLNTEREFLKAAIGSIQLLKPI